MEMDDLSPVVSLDGLQAGDFDVVLVSPHLDDAALSCPGALFRHRDAGRTVLTVVPFSHAGDDAALEDAQHYALRRDEERRAALRAGYDVLWGGFVDAPFRDPPHRTFNEIVWGQGDAELARRLISWLEEVVDAVEPTQLLAPLGVGRHIDHRLVHTATRNLERRWRDLEVWYYEDRPYALIRHAVEGRLLELGVETELCFEEFWSSFTEATYVVQHLRSQEERRICRRRFAELYSSPGRDAVERKVEVSFRLIKAGDCDSIWSVIAEHESQIESFLGSVAAFQRVCQRYARRIEPDARYLERQWRLYGL